MSYDFLGNVSGVIHVGANTGQERDIYAAHGLRVIWLEPILQVYTRLVEHIRGYPLQRAFQQLILDTDDKPCPFYISNNDGRSSSVLDLKLHQDIWPQVFYEGAILLRSLTLDTLLERERIEVRDYPALVMDTQGSELLVLKGAIQHLGQFRFIKTEVADFEAYKDCCTVKDIEQFLSPHGFVERAREPFAQRSAGGTYFDITYENTTWSG